MMNTLLNIYFKLPHDKALGIVTKVFNRFVAKIFKQLLDSTVPRYFIKSQKLFPNGLNTEKRDKEVIVSFTSFPGRIADVWIVVECLFRQTYKADRIILWLSSSQFEGVELPPLLLEQKKRGLEIRFVEGDLKSHKKYIYALMEFRFDYVITVDDDLYYDENLIENLVLLKRKYPFCIPSNRAHMVKFKDNGDVGMYTDWFHNYVIEKPSLLLVPTGGFGTLYEYSQLNDTFSDEELIQRLVPHADDLWMKVQSLVNSIYVVTNNRYDKNIISIKGSQLENLVSTNVSDGGNDVQLKSILEYFEIENLKQFRDK